MFKSNQDAMELNRTHPFLAYAGDINVIGENINGPIIKKNTRALSVDSKKIYVKIRAEKIKQASMFVSHNQQA
jgi:hypothetical protein